MAIDIKKLRKIMRTDDGINGDAKRLEELVWLLFLKLFDSKEKEWQLAEEIYGRNYESVIPQELRWSTWADNPAGITGDELLSFIDEYDISDLHDANIGYIGMRPVLVDYSSFND